MPACVQVYVGLSLLPVRTGGLRPSVRDEVVEGRQEAVAPARSCRARGAPGESLTGPAKNFCLILVAN